MAYALTVLFASFVALVAFRAARRYVRRRRVRAVLDSLTSHYHARPRW